MQAGISVKPPPRPKVSTLVKGLRPVQAILHPPCCRPATCRKTFARPVSPGRRLLGAHRRRGNKPLQARMDASKHRNNRAAVSSYPACSLTRGDGNKGFHSRTRHQRRRAGSFRRWLIPSKHVRWQECHHSQHRCYLPQKLDCSRLSVSNAAATASGSSASTANCFSQNDGSCSSYFAPEP